MIEIIYSYKAHGKGVRMSGRVCAANMQDATKQVLENIRQFYGFDLDVEIHQLKNQTQALKQWRQSKPQ